MSGAFAFPPAGFGPGSQLTDGDEGLSYLAMPSGVSTYQAHLPMIDDPESVGPALNLLATIRDRLHAWKAGDAQIVPLKGLEPASRAFVADALGEGEVAIRVKAGLEQIEIQESVFAGVWSVRTRHLASGMTRERIEIGAFPRVAAVRAFPSRPTPQPADYSQPRPGVVNAPAILTELFDHATGWQPGMAPHAINLSLLPHTPEDLALIAEMLGDGYTTILSRGYGNCRIDATATHNIWRVRYYNSMDTLILDTIEVVDMPEVACAAPEDIADSAIRLGEIHDALQLPA